jgi:hypothetical protein
LIWGVRDIATEDEPVFGVVWKLGERQQIFLERNMKIADGMEFQPQIPRQAFGTHYAHASQ